MFKNWKVVYAKPRAEKKIEEECRALGLNVYLPLRKSVRVYQRRKVTFLTPLFPGYIFVDLKPDLKNNLISYGHIARVIPVKKPVLLLRQLVMVRKALNENPELDAVDPVTVGEVVRVKSGPLLGCEGFVTRIQRKAQRMLLNISVDMIGRAIEVSVDISAIERNYNPKTKTYKHV